MMLPILKVKRIHFYSFFFHFLGVFCIKKNATEVSFTHSGKQMFSNTRSLAPMFAIF